uniref:RE58915p n=1 Tax=Drosophila melanogaster TaxID=7227 RepID=B6IDW3_DROME|nr:RE58915p [Drosophila melanogaster]
MMADRYASDLALVVVAQITQTIGYSCTLSAPLELLQDILQKFVQEFARDMHRHMEHANRIEPNLKDARLSIKNLSINVQELLDYIGNVEPVGFIRDVPQFPIGKSVNMNFLKPGSAETLTRPVYIFEYLPPMQDPELREIPADVQKEFSEKQEFCSKAEYSSTNAADKLGAKHIDSISPNTVINFRSNAFELDVGSSVREMSSVVMTTGGFISPAIEGKLPEDIIPDIVEKFLGLDAPFSPTIIVNSLQKSPQLALSDRDKTVNPRKIIPSETKIFKQNAALLTSGHSESSIIYASNNHTMLTVTTPKKNRKQKHDLICEPGQSELLTNPFEKAQEKSQRKALKMYKQTSKNQRDSSINQIQNMKKLKKKFNRGSFDPNKKHLEKIFKKQSKLKQNDLQLDIDEKHFLQNSQTTSGLAIKANSNENALQADIPSQPPTVTSQIENNFRNSIYPVQPSVIQQTQVLLAEKKSGSEPERSKLDIFKKISKPRTPRPDIGATLVPPGTGVSVFGSTMTPSALISLPSGTTITPTPSLGLNSENKNVPSMKINPCNIFDGTIPLTKAGVEMSIVDSPKPKKRGRKPGGKNVIKQTNVVSQPLINKVERKKSSQAITLPLSSSPMIITQSSLNVSPPTEPLNLCNTEQPSNNFLSNLYAKEKKDRKKYKSLPENVMQLDKSCSPEKASTLHNSIRPTKQNNDVQCSDKFVTISNALSNASIYPGIQTGMVPLLPLLQFPPRPGLIPTGPGLFPAVTGLVGFGNHGNRIPISPFIDYPGPEESVADTVRCPPIKDSPVTDSDQFLSRSSTQTDLQMDRNYCNVAPLVPDSMKFAECKSVSCASTILENPSAQATSKINTKPLLEASGNPDDPIEVSDDSDESMHNRQMVQRKTPISSPTYVKTSFAELNPSSFTSAASNGEEKSKMDLRNIVSLSSNEPLKKFKKLVKQSFPDVKSVPHTPASHSSFPQFNLPNFMGGDKFSLAGGADLIPLSRVSDSEYSSKIVPFSSLGGTIPNQIKISEEHNIFSTFSNYEDITITPTGLTSLEPKMRKHHKKLKKVKEGKNKKKKEKKDKSKKADQIGLPSFKSDRKIKANDKRQKKRKEKG